MLRDFLDWWGEPFGKDQIHYRHEHRIRPHHRLGDCNQVWGIHSILGHDPILRHMRLLLGDGLWHPH